MATITNPTIRLFHLPARSKGDETFGAGVMLLPGGAAEVPDWYLGALLKETNRAGKPTGWALRIEKTESGARVQSPGGAAGAFEQRIKAARAEKAKAEREAKASEDRAKATEKRLEALEAELASEKRETKKSEKSEAKEGKGSKTGT